MSKNQSKTRVPIKNEDLKALKQLCKKSDVSLDGLFQRLILYPNLTEQLLQFPSEITIPMVVDMATVQQKLPEWMNNIRENFEAIKTGKDAHGIPGVKNTPALIIGAGPSIYKQKHLDLLAQKGFNGLIIATDCILKECLEHGIIPDYVVCLDASEKILDYFNHDIVDKYASKITAVMCIAVHPSVVKRWKGGICWYDNYMDERYIPNVSHILSLLVKTKQFATAGHVSSLGWALASSIGCNPIVLIGLDLSYPASMPVKESVAYITYMKSLKNKEQVLKILDNHYHHKFFNTDCYFEQIFKAYTETTMKQFELAEKNGIKVINCTEGGTLEGEGVECMWFRDYLDSQ